MPFDGTIDDLADINTTRRLSVRSMKRIVRAARQAGLLLACDHTPEMGLFTRDTCPYFTPSGAVDASLGPHGTSCPCNAMSAAHHYLKAINDSHSSVLRYTVLERYKGNHRDALRAAEIKLAALLI